MAKGNITPYFFPAARFTHSTISPMKNVIRRFSPSAHRKACITV